MGNAELLTVASTRHLSTSSPSIPPATSRCKQHLPHFQMRERKLFFKELLLKGVFLILKPIRYVTTVSLSQEGASHRAPQRHGREAATEDKRIRGAPDCLQTRGTHAAFGSKSKL